MERATNHEPPASMNHDELKEELERVQKQAAAMREALRHCLEASSDPPKFGRFLTKQDRDIIFDALKPGAGREFISREQVKPAGDACAPVVEDF